MLNQVLSLLCHGQFNSVTRLSDFWKFLSPNLLTNRLATFGIFCKFSLYVKRLWQQIGQLLEAFGPLSNIWSHYGQASVTSNLYLEAWIPSPPSVLFWNWIEFVIQVLKRKMCNKRKIPRIISPLNKNSSQPSEITIERLSRIDLPENKHSIVWVLFVTLKLPPVSVSWMWNYVWA